MKGLVLLFVGLFLGLVIADARLLYAQRQDEWRHTEFVKWETPVWNSLTRARERGDWILLRAGPEHDICEAFDPTPGKARVAGTWPLRADGSCHMADFIWRH